MPGLRCVRLIREAQGSEGHFDLARFYGERQAAFRPDFQTKRDGLFNIFDGLRFRFALADTAWNGGALDDPNTVLIAVDGH